MTPEQQAEAQARHETEALARAVAAVILDHEARTGHAVASIAYDVAERSLMVQTHRWHARTMEVLRLPPFGRPAGEIERDKVAT